jgi:hypothetical protein
LTTERTRVTRRHGGDHARARAVCWCSLVRLDLEGPAADGFEYAFRVHQFGPEPSAGGFYVGALLGLVGLLMVMAATSWIGFELAMKERTAEKAEAH